MAELNGDIKKYRRGESLGNAALIFCAAVLACFIVCFSIARTQNFKTLELVTVIVAPVLMVAGVTVAAICNIKYGGAIDRLVKRYVIDVCVENAALLHPERDCLTFYLCVEEDKIILQVNGYKEKIAFDFSPFGKLSASRKLSALTEIENRLCATFCRLYERGASYKEVSYCERASRRKSGKSVYIIKDGVPDNKAFKNYLKNS